MKIKNSWTKFSLFSFLKGDIVEVIIYVNYFFSNQLKWLNIGVYNHLSKEFVIISDKGCFCEIPGEPDGKNVMQPKHAIP